MAYVYSLSISNSEAPAKAMSMLLIVLIRGISFIFPVFAWLFKVLNFNNKGRKNISLN
jgi:hypothetical protein